MPGQHAWLALVFGVLIAGAACADGEASPQPASSEIDEAASGRDAMPTPASDPSGEPAPSATTPAVRAAQRAETDEERRARYRASYIAANRAVDAALQRSCSACHGKAVAEAPCGLRFDNGDDLYVLRLVAPLSSDDSPVVQVIVEGSMPPPGVEPRPDAEELGALRAFIDDPAYWSTLPPDGRTYEQAWRDAALNACDAGMPGE